MVTYESGKYKDSVIEVYSYVNGSVKKIYDKTIFKIGLQNTYHLIRKTEGAYLMQYHLDAATGQTEQGLDIYSFTSFGKINYKYSSNVHFYMDGSPLDVGVPEKYYSDQNLYNDYCTGAELLIMSNDNGLTITASPFSQVFGNLGK